MTAYHHRQSIRLRDYDYSQNSAYFVTICTHQGTGLFGDVVDGDMVLNEWDKIVQSCWHAIPEHYPTAELDTFVIMPNHIHGIIVIKNGNVEAQDIAPLQPTDQPTRGATSTNVTPNSLGSIVRSFKAAVTRRIRQSLPMDDHTAIWQRNYYEHIIRNQESFNQIREYIVHNPGKWTEDILFSSLMDHDQ